MKRFIFALLRLIIVFLASSIVFFGLVVVVGHFLTPILNKKIHQVEALTSQFVHKPVEMDNFAISWQGLVPVIAGKEVTIWNDAHTQPLMHIHQLNIGLNLFHTLLTGTLRLNSVQIRGLSLVLHETANHQWLIKGFTDQASQNKFNKQILLALLSQTNWSLKQIGITFYNAAGEKWPPLEVNALLKNKLAQHQLSVVLKIKEKTPSNLILIANLYQPATQMRSSQLFGKIYLQGNALTLDRWIPFFKNDEDLSTKNARVNFKLWANSQQNKISQMHLLFANLSTCQLQWKPSQHPALTVFPFQSNLVWQAKNNNDWLVFGTVNNLGLLPWENLPGIKDLNAYLTFSSTFGKLITHSKALAVNFPKLFKQPLYFDKLISEVDWQRSANNVLVKVPKFIASNFDLTANGKMRLNIPSDLKNIDINLLSHVHTSHPSHIANYLPYPYLGPKLTRWLSHAILKGTGDATILLQGPLRQFPFDQHQGTFVIDTQIKDGELHYQPKWPNLQNIDSELIFSDRQMQMNVRSAQIFGTPLHNVVAKIPVIKSKVQAVLNIAPTMIDTTLQHGIAFLKATPLATDLGELSNLSITGPLKLILQLNIPLEDGKSKFQMLGEGNTQNGQIKIPSQHIQIDQLQGQFIFNQTGITTKNLQGILWNKPINLGLKAGSKQIYIDYNGLQTVLNPLSEGWQFLLNNENFKGSVLIPKDTTQPIEATFSSVRLGKEQTAKTWKIDKIPNLNFQANEVFYNSMAFGHVQFKLRPFLNGAMIRDLEAHNPSYHLSAKGIWHKQGDRQSTELLGQLDSPDISSFLRSMGLPASLSAEQAHARFHLHWPAGPGEVNLSGLRGTVNFSASNGQISDVGSSAEAKISFGRLLTFLSLQSLSHHLQVGFNDMQARGFDFSNLEGEFTLNDGDAFTRNNVTIEGSVASITINGRIGLRNKDYDLTIYVVPHFTASLPVIVALAGGPIAGAITWVANTVLGPTVQKIAETSYHITGTWGEPEIVKTSERKA